MRAEATLGHVAGWGRGPHRHLARVLLAAGLGALLVAWGGCGGGGGDAFKLPPAPTAGEVLPAAAPGPALAAAGLDLAAESAGDAGWRRLEAGGEIRTALVTAADGWTWSGEVPAEGRLHVGVAAPAEIWPQAERRAGRLEVTVTARPAGGGEEVSARAVLAGPTRDEVGAGEEGAGEEGETGAWHDLELDLSAFAGRRVEVSARAAVSDVAVSDVAASDVTVSDAAVSDVAAPAPVVAWSPISLAAPFSAATGEAAGDGVAATPEPRRPNVLFIVVDTLRADHLGAYGYHRDTSPRIDELLAGRGVVLEQAWAQAPWTLPSAVSYFTGRYPGEILSGHDLRTEFAIPAAVPSLAERFRRLGYRTAGFYANPTLHAGNGFARGFESFYTPPPTPASLALHGDTVTERALPWLRSHGGEPFFLYLHYLDPHDPYTAPVVEATGRTPFDPGYGGAVDGTWPHALFSGDRELPDPERDLEHLVALYDSEVAYVDGEIGRLLDALPEAVLADTLVVLTSDHGEELLDHGWWKHGITVYEEQLRVPLILRWDGRLPAGARVRRPVELVDLVPTLLAAARVGNDGGARDSASDSASDRASDGALDGVDLLPSLTGADPAGRAAGFAQHLSSGPARVAVRLGEWKLALFDRRSGAVPDAGMARRLYRVSMGRLARVELYHLGRDPGEHRNVADQHPRLVERLAPLALRQLDAQGRPGLRVAAGAVPRGARLTGEVRFQAPPEGWESDFLAPADEVALEGDRLRFDLVGEGWPKGLRVLGDTGGVEEVRLRLAGAEVAPARVSLGGRPWAGDPVAAAALVAEGWPPAAALSPGSSAPLLVVWRPDTVARTAVPGGDEAARETERRLRALGYIQ